MRDEILISCQNVSKRFCRDFRRSLVYGCVDSARDLLGVSSEIRTGDSLREGEFLSVKDASFELRRGESLGLIGRNGAGKTTLLKILNGLIKPDSGKVIIRGRVGALIALGAGFNPILTARENIMVNGAILGLPRKRIKEVFDDIIEFAGIEDFVDSPLRTFSSGMSVRLGFAIAAHMEPDILLIDEVLAVGDLAFRQKCLRFIEGFKSQGGSFILVTHNLNQILSSCEKAVLLDKGEVVANGPSIEVVNKAIELQFGDKVGKSQKENSERDQYDRLVSIESASLSGVSSEAIRSGEEVVAEVRVKSRLDAENVVCHFYIWTDDFSKRLLSLQSRDFGQNYQVSAGEEYCFRCVIPTLPLAPGRYGLRFKVYADGTLRDAIGYEDGWIWAQVHPSSVSHNELRRAVLGDLVWADCKWE